MNTVMSVIVPYLVSTAINTVVSYFDSAMNSAITGVL